jgi:hypothetical protein
MKLLKRYEIKEDNKGYPVGVPIKVNKLKDGRRLLSRLIHQLQTGQVSGQVAKDLCYLLTTYVNVFRTAELEQRIEALEKVKDERH